MNTVLQTVAHIMYATAPRVCLSNHSNHLALACAEEGHWATPRAEADKFGDQEGKLLVAGASGEGKKAVSQLKGREEERDAAYLTG